MRALQRVSAAITWLALVVVGVLFIAEATNVIDGRWRNRLAGPLRQFSAPTFATWIAALVALGLAVAAVLVLIAQFVPYRRSSQFQYTVDVADDGETAVTARAVLVATRYVLTSLQGIVDASAVLTPRGHARIRLQVGDGANVDELAQLARQALGSAFWTNLGIDARRTDLVFEYRRASARAVT